MVKHDKNRENALFCQTSINNRKNNYISSECKLHIIKYGKGNTNLIKSIVRFNFSKRGSKVATIGDRLRYLIHKRGMDQKKFAEIFGLKVSTLNGYVTNYRTPDIDMQKRFADYFEVTVDYLIGRTDSEVRQDFFYTVSSQEDLMAEKEIYGKTRGDNTVYYLSEEMYDFVMDPQNEKYIRLAADLKNKGINPEDIIPISSKCK